MSVTKLVNSKNLFINTDDSINGDGVQARFTVPPGIMDCKPNQTLTVTLSSFNMRQGFYRINRFNNVFYVLFHENNTDVVKATRVILEEGDYTMFWTNDDNLTNADSNWNASTTRFPAASQSTTLCTQIKYALLNSITYDITKSETGGKFAYTASSNPTDPVFAGPQSQTSFFNAADIDITYDDVKGRIMIDFKKVAPSIASATATTITPENFKIVGFYCKNYVNKSDKLNIYTQIITTPDGLNDLDLFSSSFEIMGGCGETRSVPIGTTVTEQFKNIRVLQNEHSVGETVSAAMSKIENTNGASWSTAAYQILNITTAILQDENIFVPISSAHLDWLEPNGITPITPSPVFDITLHFKRDNISGVLQNTGHFLNTVPLTNFNTNTDIPVNSTFKLSQTNLQQADGFQNATIQTTTNTFDFKVTEVAPIIKNVKSIGQYKATLQSEECVYLRTDLPADNYQTLGFDTGDRSTPEIQPTTILAKIPLNNPINTGTMSVTQEEEGVTKYNAVTYQQAFEYINYIDNGNNLYSIQLNTPHVNQFHIFLTDSYGRNIPFASPEQGLCQALSFSCDLRIDTTEEIIQKTIQLN